MTVSNPLLEDDPLWYKNAVIYQLHVRAFHDSDGDGIGDFRGLTQKLGYLQDLGVTALWLLPFYPSPLRDDGYDIADYTDIHPSYGNLRDFREFIGEAHRRGLRVITELVLNHTSDQHPWFQRARRAKPGTKHRDYYVWSDTDEKYAGVRIIFKDFETSNWTWDPVAQAYYWHRFYSHQPDLNFENPAVQRSLLRALDFWFNMGVDGLRLDAVPYLYEREGTICENLPETHEFLKKLRRHVDERYRGRMLLAEANQWPEDAIAYFGGAVGSRPSALGSRLSALGQESTASESATGGPPTADSRQPTATYGDECHMAFHFPLMPRLFMGIRMEDRFPIIDILQQTPEIPENCQWAIFLRNHDELTLEMVTDEERDYMYRVYAHDREARINLGIRRRLAPLLQHDRRKIELMNGLLFSMPGTPIVYYGDEIGMGDNVYLGDRNGVRTPMQWSADRNAGFSRANPQKLYLPVIIDPEYHFETVNVEAQSGNPSSMLWWMRRLIARRKQYRVFGEGTMEFLHPENPRVLAFIRTLGSQRVLVIANLSRFVQCAELDLAQYNGMQPVELFGMTKFPLIGELPYFLTLGPHSFYWFALEEQEAAVAARQGAEPPTVQIAGAWTNLFRGRGRETLEAVLPRVLATRRWFGGKARRIEAVELLDAVPLLAGGDDGGTSMIMMRVAYHDAEDEVYQAPVAFASGALAAAVERDDPQAVLLRVRAASSRAERIAANSFDDGVVYDASYSRDFRHGLLESIFARRRFRGEAGEIVAHAVRRPTQAMGRSDGVDSSVSRADQSNTCITYGDRYILKLFRRLALGVNPDVEIGRFLTERAAFPNTPDVAGFMEYRSGASVRGRKDEVATVAVLQQYVVNEGDAWSYTLSALGAYFERVLTEETAEQTDALHPPDMPRRPLLDEAAGDPHDLPGVDLIGAYMQSAELLGQRTAEMHLALASDPDDPDFAPEPITPHDQRSLYQSMRNLTRTSMRTLRSRIDALPAERPEVIEAARTVLAREEQILDEFSRVREGRLGGQRIRTHGDYHLGQVLFTGRDFLIIDFEGEPGRPLSERRMKRSALRDVAGMIRSFDYAAFTALREHQRRFGIASEEVERELDAWGRLWRRVVSAAFLRSYLATAGGAPFLPVVPEQTEILLEAFILEKAVYELEYELNNRPEWVQIPLGGILSLLSLHEAAAGTGDAARESDDH